MATTHGKPHILVITYLPAEGEYEAVTEYEIEHPAECPTETYGEGMFVYTEHTCDVGYEVVNVGLDGLCWDAKLVPDWVKPEGAPEWSSMRDWEGLPEGRYVIQAWHSFDSYSGECDGGMDLLGVEGEVEIVA